MDLQNLFWNSSIEELKQGYILDSKTNQYICLICGETFDKNEIFKINSKFYNAKKATEYHIVEKHNSSFDYLINLNKKYNGLSDQQREIMSNFKKGYSDSETAKNMNLSVSTIRNYRFKFREKEKQSKIFLAMMENLKNDEIAKNQMISPHRTATMLDERYEITKKEYQDTLKKYLDSNGAIISFPKKEKRKIILLTEISKIFKFNEIYSEIQINRILIRIYEDYVLIRRYLIEYGFLDRSPDGSKYWLKDSSLTNQK